MGRRCEPEVLLRRCLRRGQHGVSSSVRACCRSITMSRSGCGCRLSGAPFQVDRDLWLRTKPSGPATATRHAHSGRHPVASGSVVRGCRCVTRLAAEQLLDYRYFRLAMDGSRQRPELVGHAQSVAAGCGSRGDSHGARDAASPIGHRATEQHLARRAQQLHPRRDLGGILRLRAAGFAARERQAGFADRVHLAAQRGAWRD